MKDWVRGLYEKKMAKATQKQVKQNSICVHYKESSFELARRMFSVGQLTLADYWEGIKRP